MPGMSNEELVTKAAIVVSDLATGGKLNAAQSDKFIDYVIEETVLKDNARIVRFRNEDLVIDKIGVGQRVAVPKAEAVDPQVRRGINTSTVTLSPKEIMVPFEIGDNFREANIEGDSVEDTVIRMMATQLANDLEDMYINGNEFGAAVPEEDIIDGGSALSVKDSYLALADGWSLLADSGNVVDAAGQNIGLSVFGKAIRAMPTKFRRNMGVLRWMMSPDLWQLYLEKLSTRATGLGDAAAVGGQGEVGPYGIKAISAPLWAFEPRTVEHLVLPDNIPVALKNGPVTNLVAHVEALGSSPTAALLLTTDYTVDLAAGTITNVGSGAIGDGDTVKVTYDSSPQIMLTHMSNMIVGIGRDVRIEKDRDIYKGVNQYAITVKADVQFEELTAVVKVRNIGLGV